MGFLQKLIVTTLATTAFLAFFWGVKGHFISQRMPAAMKLVSALSLAGFVSLLWNVWNRTSENVYCDLTACGFYLVSFALFYCSIRATRSFRLTLAFDSDRPEFIVTNGPYRWIRHPFYTSYLLFWIGCAIASPSIDTMSLIAALVVTYWIAATREEGKFAISAFAHEYRAYRKRAGLFWPRIGAGN